MWGLRVTPPCRPGAFLYTDEERSERKSEPICPRREESRIEEEKEEGESTNPIQHPEIRKERPLDIDKKPRTNCSSWKRFAET